MVICPHCFREAWLCSRETMLNALKQKTFEMDLLRVELRKAQASDWCWDPRGEQLVWCPMTSTYEVGIVEGEHLRRRADMDDRPVFALTPMGLTHAKRTILNDAAEKYQNHLAGVIQKQIDAIIDLRTRLAKCEPAPDVTRPLLTLRLDHPVGRPTEDMLGVLPQKVRDGGLVMVKVPGQADDPSQERPKLP